MEYKNYGYVPLPESVDAASRITEHFRKVRDRGLEMAKELVGSSPKEGAEMIMAVEKYMEFQRPMMRGILNTEHRRAAESGVPRNDVRQLVSVRLNCPLW